MDRHREIMEAFMKTLIESKASPVITEAKFADVVQLLKNPETQVTPKFKYWVKTKQFQLINIPALGLADALVVPKKKQFGPRKKVKRHVSLLDVTDDLSLQVCEKTDCCDGKLVHCPLCTVKKCQPLSRKLITEHIHHCHIKPAVKTSEWLLLQCRLNCGVLTSPHYHCPCGLLLKDKITDHLLNKCVFRPKKQKSSVESEETIKQTNIQSSSTDGIKLENVSESGIDNADQARMHRLDQQDILESCDGIKREAESDHLKRKGSVMSVYKGQSIWDTQTDYKPNFEQRQRRDEVLKHFPFAHKSMVYDVTDFDITRCGDCCMQFHCPLCPLELFKPHNPKKVIDHLQQTHFKSNVMFQDLNVLKCRLDCLPVRRKIGQTHYHCPLCPVKVNIPARFKMHLMCHSKGTNKIHSRHKPFMADVAEKQVQHEMNKVDYDVKLGYQVVEGIDEAGNRIEIQVEVPVGCTQMLESINQMEEGLPLEQMLPRLQQILADYPNSTNSEENTEVTGHANVSSETISYENVVGDSDSINEGQKFIVQHESYEGENLVIFHQEDNQPWKQKNLEISSRENHKLEICEQSVPSNYNESNCNDETHNQNKDHFEETKSIVESQHLNINIDLSTNDENHIVMTIDRSNLSEKEGKHEIIEETEIVCPKEAEIKNSKSESETIHEMEVGYPDKNENETMCQEAAECSNRKEGENDDRGVNEETAGTNHVSECLDTSNPESDGSCSGKEAAALEQVSVSLPWRKFESIKISFDQLSCMLESNFDVRTALVKNMNTELFQMSGSWDDITYVRECLSCLFQKMPMSLQEVEDTVQSFAEKLKEKRLETEMETKIETMFEVETEGIIEAIVDSVIEEKSQKTITPAEHEINEPNLSTVSTVINDSENINELKQVSVKFSKGSNQISQSSTLAKTTRSRKRVERGHYRDMILGRTSYGEKNESKVKSQKRKLEKLDPCNSLLDSSILSEKKAKFSIEQNPVSSPSKKEHVKKKSVILKTEKLDVLPMEIKSIQDDDLCLKTSAERENEKETEAKDLESGVINDELCATDDQIHGSDTTMETEEGIKQVIICKPSSLVPAISAFAAGPTSMTNKEVKHERLTGINIKQLKENLEKKINYDKVSQVVKYKTVQSSDKQWKLLQLTDSCVTDTLNKPTDSVLNSKKSIIDHGNNIPSSVSQNNMTSNVSPNNTANQNLSQNLGQNLESSLNDVNFISEMVPDVSTAAGTVSIRDIPAGSSEMSFSIHNLDQNLTVVCNQSVKSETQTSDENVTEPTVSVNDEKLSVERPEYLLLGLSGETCPICKTEQFTSREDLLLHILSTECSKNCRKKKSHLPKDLCTQIDSMNKCTTNSCYICRREFTGLFQAKIHYALQMCRPRQKKNPHNIPKNPTTSMYYCELCGYEGNVPHKIWQHMQRKHLQKEFPCDICNIMFTTPQFMQAHKEKVHYDQKKTICEHCGKEVYAKYIKRHYNDVHNPNYTRSSRVRLNKILKCFLCRYETHVIGDLKRHVKRIHGEKVHKCDQCPANFAYLGDLNVHIKTIHQPREMVGCPKCSKKLYANNLALHIRNIHDQQKDFICRICGKALQSMFSLRYHLETHKKPSDREYKFKCSECGNGFMNKSVLLDHMNTHTGLRPYKCDMCLKSFRQRSVYHKHLEIHNNVKFMCAFCGLIFNDKKHVMEHKEKAHSNHYSCVCGQTFQRHDYFTKHLQACNVSQSYVSVSTQESDNRQDREDIANETKSSSDFSVLEISSNDLMSPEEAAAVLAEHAPEYKGKEIIQLEDGTMLVIQNENVQKAETESKDYSPDVAQTVQVKVEQDDKQGDPGASNLMAGFEDSNYQCAYCQGFFSTMEDTERHIIQNHMDGPAETTNEPQDEQQSEKTMTAVEMD